VVAVSSAAGLIGIFGYSAYGPAKFAVRGLMESVRAELTPHGVRNDQTADRGEGRGGDRGGYRPPAFRDPPGHGHTGAGAVRQRLDAAAQLGVRPQGEVDREGGPGGTTHAVPNLIGGLLDRAEDRSVSGHRTGGLAC
jgi:hypothetical protein